MRTSRFRKRPTIAELAIATIWLFTGFGSCAVRESSLPAPSYFWTTQTMFASDAAQAIGRRATLLTVSAGGASKTPRSSVEHASE